jgi:dTMP kinase
MSDGASRGFFIVLEGIDGSGKTTQCRLLAEWLRGQGVPLVATAEPGGTPLGQRVRSLLLDGSDAISPLAELFLFQASRAQLLEQLIRPALAAGQVVLCDRYTLSTIAYQGYAGGLPLDVVRQSCTLATAGLEPDLIVLLDLPVADSLPRRKAPDRVESRGAEYHQRVRDGFLSEVQLLARTNPRGCRSSMPDRTRPACRRNCVGRSSPTQTGPSPTSRPTTSAASLACLACPCDQPAKLV